MKKKPIATDGWITSGIRFKSLAQRELIKRAAIETDTSMNSFIRTAAEKAARAILAAAAARESYKDSNNATD